MMQTESVWDMSGAAIQNTKIGMSFIIALFFSGVCHPIKIDRVILSSNENLDYLEYWPLASRAWKKLGFMPTLILVTEDSIAADTTYGDVVRFKPIPHISTVFQAQCIRLLAPAWFPDDICVIADIDLLPVDPNFFVEPLSTIPDDAFVVYRQPYADESRYFMCFNVARGDVFADVFGILPCRYRGSLQSNCMRYSSRKAAAKSSEYFFDDNEIRILLHTWWNETGGAWITDEKMLYRYIHNWRHYATHAYILGKGAENIIFEGSFVQMSVSDMLSARITEVNLPKGYRKHKQKIKTFARAIGIFCEDL